MDWERLNKALTVEKEYGYQNLQGRQHRFSEFLCLTFGEIPPVNNLLIVFRWQETAKNFARYPQMTQQERIDLISQTEALIAEVREMQHQTTFTYDSLENRTPAPISAEVNPV